MVGYQTVVLEVLGLIPADGLIWFSKMFFFIQSEAKNSKSYKFRSSLVFSLSLSVCLINPEARGLQL